MRRKRNSSARTLAGAFLFLAGGAAAALPLRIAAERPDAVCPAGRILSLVHPDTDLSLPPAATRCIAIVPVADVSDAGLDAASEKIRALPDLAGVVLEIQNLPAANDPSYLVRIPFAVKRLSSEARAASPGAEIALDLTDGLPEGVASRLPAEDLGPYLDAQVLRPDRGHIEVADVRDRWILAPRGDTPSAPGKVLRLLEREAAVASSITLVGLLTTEGHPLPEPDWKALERLQSFWTFDVSRDPTETNAARVDGSSANVLRYFDAKNFRPILLLPEDSAGRVTITLAAPYVKATVENLDSGARKEFDLKGAASLSLDLSHGPLAAVLQPASRPGGEERAAVEVGAARGLTAEEIVARERVWDAGQREKTHTYIAFMNASLRFRVADVNETFDLTIEGDYFFRRGKDPDWAWQRFYLNGVKWKGRTLPKLPILQPEKVTTLPLDIQLTEAYAYTLKRQTRIAGRRAYEITFTPTETVGERPIYRGTVWIDARTFALLRRDSVQLNLKGETLSNIQDEYYRPVPGRPDVYLPLLIRGQQVFSTAGRTTAIERNVTMSRVEINPADLEKRLAEAYASGDQMIRDTDQGLRYLLPDPDKPGARIVEEHFSRKSTFGLLGGFYDGSLDYPIPLAGFQHFNFDLWGKGKQLSLFFGGVLMTFNYSDPALFGSRFDLGTDVFAVAIPFKDTAYRDGVEIPSEAVKNLPEIFQLNVGRPLGPYLKASIGGFSRWDDYQRDDTTGASFVVPVDTFTNGFEARLVANYLGFNAALTGSYLDRVKWEPWGFPDNPDYSPGKKDYWKYGVTLSKDQYFKNFRKLHVSLSYLGGSDLDRFSEYEFGTFSGHPLRGYSSGSLRADSTAVMNISYGLNVENIIRFEGFFDQALVWNKLAGYDARYFSGVGLLASLNGPWQNSLVRGEVGVPAVSHGIHGVVVYLTVLKLF